MNLEELLLKKIRESSEADERVLSDRTITDTIGLYGLPEEDKVDEFVEKLTPLFKTVAGQSRALLSKAKEEREKELERIKLEYKNLDPKRESPKDGEEDKNSDSMEKPEEGIENPKDDITKTLLEELKSIKDELSGIKEKEAFATKKQALSNYAKELRLSDEYVLNQAMRKIDLKGKDVDELKKELEVAYSKEYKACRNAEAPTFGSGGGKDAAASYLERKFAEKKAEKSNIYKPKFD